MTDQRTFGARAEHYLMACILAGTALAAQPALATTGYFANGTSTESKGMAGAGVAIGTGAMGMVQNPAMGTRYPNRAEACISFFAPSRSATISAPTAATDRLIPGTYKSGNPFFPVPCGGANFALKNGSTLGVMLYGNGGMNTEYSSNFFAGLVPPPGAATTPLGVNLEQLFLQVNYAFEVNDQVSVGIAPIFAAQRFSATGLEAFAGSSLSPANTTNNGDDWSTGYGLSLGVTWQATPNLSFGAKVRSKIDMSPFKSYSGLFAEGGDFDIPATAALGLAYTPESYSALTLTAEWERIFYSKVAALSNTSAPPGGAGGSATGAGFGWKDMDVFRVGAEYVANPRWTLRGGLSYNTAFADGPEALINTLAPATPQWHASIGATWQINDRREFHVAYTHAFDNSLSGVNTAFGGQTVTDRMSQDELTLGMTWKW